MSLPVSEKLILRQIHHWNHLQAILKRSPPPDPRARRPVITVSRQAGSGGRLVAQELAAVLDCELQDQSLMDPIARDRNLEKSMVAKLDEQVIDQAALWVEGVLKRRIFLKDEFHVALVKVITRLAARGGVVFLGRGAELILAEKADLRLRIVGSPGIRLQNIVDRTGLSRPEARALLKETDRRRTEFIRRIFNTEPGNPTSYDLVLNADRMSPSRMVEVALSALTEMAPPVVAEAEG